MRELLVDSTAFKQWLLSKKEDEIVGVTRCSYRCPIRNFLSETLNEDINVGSTNIWFFNDNNLNTYFIADYPWLKSIIDKIDESTDCDFTDVPLTAKQVLNLLSYIE